MEIDSDGVPQREVGFDEAGRAIVAGPFGKNYGFWTDSAMRFEEAGNKVVANEEFDPAWSAFETSHAEIAKDE